MHHLEQVDDTFHAAHPARILLGRRLRLVRRHHAEEGQVAVRRVDVDLEGRRAAVGQQAQLRGRCDQEISRRIGHAAVLPCQRHAVPPDLLGGQLVRALDLAGDSAYARDPGGVAHGAQVLAHGGRPAGKENHPIVHRPHGDAAAGERLIGPERLLDLVADLGIGSLHQHLAGAADHLEDVVDVLHAVDLPDGVLRLGLLVRGADPAMQGDAAVHRVDVNSRPAQAVGREQGHLGPGRDPGVGCDRQCCPGPGQRQERREHGTAYACRCLHRVLPPGTVARLAPESGRD